MATAGAKCHCQLTGDDSGLVDEFGEVIPHALAFGASLPAGFGDAAGAADADAEGVAPPPMLHGLGFEDGVALSAAPGAVALGPQPPSEAAMVTAISKNIGFFMFGVLRPGACTTSRKAVANRPAD